MREFKHKRFQEVRRNSLLKNHRNDEKENKNDGGMKMLTKLRMRILPMKLKPLQQLCRSFAGPVHPPSGNVIVVVELIVMKAPV
jgi:hypothetical protein